MSQDSNIKQNQKPDTSDNDSISISISSSSSSSSDSNNVNQNDNVNNNQNIIETKYFAVKGENYFFKTRYVKEKENGLSLVLDEDAQNGKYMLIKLISYTS